MVLLEAEEAKTALALLRAKADQWIRFHEIVAKTLGHAKRELATRVIDPECKAEREALERMLPSFGDSMNAHSVLALDDELESALARLEKAEARKKEIGFH